MGNIRQIRRKYQKQRKSLQKAKRFKTLKRLESKERRTITHINYVIRKQLVQLSYIIRSLKIEDEPFLWEMLYQALFTPPGVKPFPEDIIYQPELAKYVQTWGKDGDLGFIAMIIMSCTFGLIYGWSWFDIRGFKGFVVHTVIGSMSSFFVLLVIFSFAWYLQGES